MDNFKNYKEISNKARKKVLEMIYKAQTSHIGSNFSCIDLLTVLFEKSDLDKDKIILSKGWAAASLYYFLWRKGRITKEELDSYCQPGSKFIGLAEPIIPEIPFAGGSMGYGLPSGIGFTLAKKLKREEGKVFVLMSDGEMQCGTTYESLLIARQYNLSNLVVWLDNNCFQAMGKTRDILDIEPLEDKIKSFGWFVQRINGHNFEQIENAWKCTNPNLPNYIICDTIKGKGWKRAEGNNIYHYKAPSKDEYEEAIKELSLLSKESS